MTRAAASAALVLWLLGSICGSVHVLAAPADAAASGHEHHALAATHGHGAGTSRADPDQRDPESDACALHCKLVARALPAASLGAVPLAVAIFGATAAFCLATRSPSLRPSSVRRLRAPPWPADLPVRHCTLLI